MDKSNLQLVLDAVKGVDHRLERLADDHKEDMTELNRKLDAVNATAVKKGDCDNCQKRWQDQIKDKIDKRPFLIAGGSIGMLVLVLTLLNLWLAVNAGVVKAVMSP